jgi:O-antigen/teichoic acid export membrane protein
MARNLSISDYGLITTVFTLANILSSFFEFGFNNYFQREAASRSAEFNYDFHNALSIKLISLLVYLVIIFFYFIDGISKSFIPFLIIGLTSYILSFNNLFSRVLFGKSSYKPPFIAILIARSSLMLLTFIAFIVNSDLNVILTVFLISSLIQLSVLIYYLNKTENLSGLKFQLLSIKKIFKSSLPMGFGILFVWIYDKVDILLIQRIIGVENVSFYSIAYSFYKFPQIFSGVVLLPLFTELSRKFIDSEKILFTDIKQNFLVLMFISLFFIGFYLIAADYFIPFIYGEKYRQSIGILKLLVVAIPALFLNNLTGVVLNAIKREKKVMISTFFGLLVNVFINIVFLKEIGVKAAIYSTIITEYFVFFFQVYLIKNSKSLVFR